MVTYILLMKITDKGALDIKHSPERVVDAMKLWESMGGKTLGIYLTTGEYDYVAFGEGPDDQHGRRVLAGLGRQRHGTHDVPQGVQPRRGKADRRGAAEGRRPRDLTNHFAADAPHRRPLCRLAQMR